MVVQLLGVVKRYGDEIAVDNVDIAIGQGEIVGLLGPNGAGKTTTINVINGLTTFDAGEVRLFDKPIGGNDRAIRRRIGVVPQDIAVFEDLTARENVAYFASLYGLSGRDLGDGVDFALDHVKHLDVSPDLARLQVDANRPEFLLLITPGRQPDVVFPNHG